MEIEEIKRRFNAALEDFYKHDYRLVERDVNERSIAHRLAVHLENFFPEYHVDCEYNKNGDEKRFLIYEVGEAIIQQMEAEHPGRGILKKIIDGEIVFNTTYPDIIIHGREYNDRNILVIEVKKYLDIENLSASQREHISIDHRKLEGFTRPITNDGYGYTLGLFLNLSNQGISKCTLTYFEMGMGQDTTS